MKLKPAVAKTPKAEPKNSKAAIDQWALGFFSTFNIFWNDEINSFDSFCLPCRAMASEAGVEAGGAIVDIRRRVRERQFITVPTACCKVRYRLSAYYP